MKQFLDPCEHYRRDLCLLAGGVLSETERGEIESHLAACTNCRKYHAEIKAVTAPFENWEENFSHLQPSRLAQVRWAAAIQAAEQTEPVRQFMSATSFHKWCQDVLWPYRRIWSGLVAVWLLMAVINFSQRDHSTTAISTSSPAAEMASFHDQQKFLNELLADRSLPAEANRPKTYSPKPRTEAVEFFST